MNTLGLQAKASAAALCGLAELLWSHAGALQVDARRHSLVYLTYSDRVIEGSPQNSVVVVSEDRTVTIPLR